MILDVKIACHHNYELFDADGNKLQYVVWADTESGRIKRCVIDNNKPRVNEYGEWLFEEVNVPAPLKAIKHEWRFSQEQMDDTILPKMDLSDMSMKNKSKLSKEVGDAIMGKSAKPEIFVLGDRFTISLGHPHENKHDIQIYHSKHGGYFYSDHNEVSFDYVDTEKLKGLADFIYKYLEKNK